MLDCELPETKEVRAENLFAVKLPSRLGYELGQSEDDGCVESRAQQNVQDQTEVVVLAQPVDHE